MSKYFAHFMGSPSLCDVCSFLARICFSLCSTIFGSKLLISHAFILYHLSFVLPSNSALLLYYFAIYCTLWRRLILTLSLRLRFSCLRKSFLTPALSLEFYQLSHLMQILKFHKITNDLFRLIHFCSLSCFISDVCILRHTSCKIQGERRPNWSSRVKFCPIGWKGGESWATPRGQYIDCLSSAIYVVIYFMR